MKLLAGLFALVLAWLGTPAMAQDANPLMMHLEFEELRGILAELDITVTEEGVDEDGDFYFDAITSTDFPFSIYGARCDEEDPSRDCMDLNAVGTFSLAEGAHVHDVMDTISYAFMKVYTSGGDVKISRYLIFDGGMTRDNLKENILIFTEIADLIWEQLTEAGVLED